MLYYKLFYKLAQYSKNKSYNVNVRLVFFACFFNGISKTFIKDIFADYKYIFINTINYIINIATIVVTTKPIITGLIFFLANSKGSTPQIAATGITAQGIIVPPPTHIPDI